MSEDPSAPQTVASVSVATEGPSSAQRLARPHRRRRRRRRRGGGRSASSSGGLERAEELSVSGPEKPVEGVLFLPARENAPGVLVSARSNYLPSSRDPLVPRELIAREGLESGAMVTGVGVEGSRSVLKRVETVEGVEPTAFR